VAFTFDNPPPSGTPGVLVAFCEGDAARELGREPPETRRKVIVDALAAFFGPRAAEPRDYVELDWTEEEWTRGCYGGHMPPGVLIRYGPALREPVGGSTGRARKAPGCGAATWKERWSQGSDRVAVQVMQGGE
jgi:monoamine oxidase